MKNHQSFETALAEGIGAGERLRSSITGNRIGGSNPSRSAIWPKGEDHCEAEVVLVAPFTSPHRRKTSRTALRRTGFVR